MRIYLILVISLLFSFHSTGKKEEPSEAEALTPFVKLNPITVSVFKEDAVSRIITLSFVIETFKPDQVADLLGQQRRIESTLSLALNSSSRTFSRAKNDYELIKNLALTECHKAFGKDKIKSILLDKVATRNN